MEIPFDQLVSCSIKRLTRPKFKNEFAQLYDGRAFQDFDLQPGEVKVVHDEDLLRDLMNRCDVSYDSVPASAALNFNSSFGKISTGEHFKVLFTIQNSSASYNLDELDIKSTVIRIQKQEG